MKFLDHTSDYLDKLSVAVKRIRFVALVGGVGLTSVGHYLRGSNITWQADIAGPMFWVGIIMLLLMNFLLVFIDKQSVEALKSLYEQEKSAEELSAEVKDLRHDYAALAAWLSLSKLLAELLDQAISSKKT